MTVFPTQQLFIKGQISDSKYRPVVTGEMPLVIEATVEYDGPSGHYKECVKEQFATEHTAFYNLGACTH